MLAQGWILSDDCKIRVKSQRWMIFEIENKIDLGWFADNDRIKNCGTFFIAIQTSRRTSVTMFTKNYYFYSLQSITFRVCKCMHWRWRSKKNSHASTLFENKNSSWTFFVRRRFATFLILTSTWMCEFKKCLFCWGRRLDLRLSSRFFKFPLMKEKCVRKFQVLFFNFFS